jgi:hypothetical protein
MSRWEIRIAAVIAALLLGATPNPASGVEQEPGMATAVLETLASTQPFW